jgi:hypothetical protein
MGSDLSLTMHHHIGCERYCICRRPFSSAFEDEHVPGDRTRHSYDPAGAAASTCPRATCPQLPSRPHRSSAHGFEMRSHASVDFGVQSWVSKSDFGVKSCKTMERHRLPGNHGRRDGEWAVRVLLEVMLAAFRPTTTYENCFTGERSRCK